MNEATRRRISNAMFIAALPICILILILGWDSEAWKLAKPVSLAVAGLAWWIAPAQKEAQK